MYEQPLITIAVGDSHASKNWRNISITWEEFKRRCQDVKRTRESYGEYMRKNPKDQLAIKDQGGYVGGENQGNRRLKNTIVYRSMITLDGDFCKPGTWTAFKEKTQYAVCAYSTHKHNDAVPRIRINIPFSREVRVEEYEPIARMISSDFGMECLDHSALRINQLMFWPTASRDGDWFYDEIEGPFLDPDQILGRYKDWHDVSQWPVGDNDNKHIHRLYMQQADPLTKPGLIGAFCRAYSIDEAIQRFLPHVYDPCDTPGRYTCIGGSTFAGAVIYQERFLYSNHSSDIIQGELCNAFDLVRRHLFTEPGDVEERGEKSEAKARSEKQMLDFIKEDPLAKAQAAEDKVIEAAEDYAGYLKDMPGADISTEQLTQQLKDYMSELEMDTKGSITTCVSNIEIIIQKDPRWAGKIRYNQFTSRLTVLAPLPWKKGGAKGRVWTDADWAGLKCYLGKRPYYIKRTAIIDDVVLMLEEYWSYHPIKDYLSSCKWDGVPRMETLFIDYLGAEDCEYVRQVTRKTLIAGIARIYEPGIKFDNMPVLAGPQGIGKSLILKKLGGEWFTSNFNFHMISDNGGNKAKEQLQGNWIVEAAEMGGYRKVEAAQAKSFISETEDEFRPAYGREKVIRPRQCIFFGSTNEERPLQDNNGNRRFWVINLFGGSPRKAHPYTISKEDVKQIWGEAMYYYHEVGEELILSDEMEREALAQQGIHEVRDEREGLISQYLETLLPVNWDSMGIYERQGFIKNPAATELQPDGTVQRTRVSAVEIWVELFEKSKGDMDPQKTRFIHEAIKRSGNWEVAKSKAIVGRYGRQTVYVRKNCILA